MVIVRNKEIIQDVLADKSLFLSEYLAKENSEFVLYYKYLTHSDLPTFAKATKQNNLHKNLLYYLTIQEMKDIETRNNRPFETAHQSNIGLPKDFWEDLEMLHPRETVNIDDPSYKLINNYADVYLVNDVLKYFTCHYTNKIFEKLDKEKHSQNKWNTSRAELNIDPNENLTPIELNHAVHGIGISTDKEFHKLRHHMFKNDILFLLIEKRLDGSKNLFIAPSKNPVFFTLIGESNSMWEKYMYEEQRKLESLIAQDHKLFETEKQTRIHQDKWRRLLADEMMNYTTNDDEVFCPFTWVSADFNRVGTVFRASHIKAYSDSNEEEKYDINNGLLLLASTDALFDKHYITVNEAKELVFSFLIANDRKLINQLLLSQPIFKDILNDERMKYLEFHRNKFFEKEQERKEPK